MRCITMLSLSTAPLVNTFAILAISPNAKSRIETLDANSKAYKMLRSSFSMLANCFMVAVPFYATLYRARRIRKRVSISPKPSNGMSRRDSAISAWVYCLGSSPVDGAAHHLPRYPGPGRGRSSAHCTHHHRRYFCSERASQGAGALQRRVGPLQHCWSSAGWADRWSFFVALGLL